MTYKKTWLSYVIWAIFTCITGVMLANYTILFWTKIIDPMVGLGTVVLVVGVFAVNIGLSYAEHINIRSVYNKYLHIILQNHKVRSLRILQHCRPILR